MGILVIVRLKLARMNFLAYNVPMCLVTGLAISLIWVKQAASTCRT